MSAAEKWNGNTMGGERVRNADDAYCTPPRLANAICRKLRETIGPIGQIVEPNAGGGAFVRAALAAWPGVDILAVEPHWPETGRPEGASTITCTWENLKADWIFQAPQSQRLLILGNPPFLLAEEHVRLALTRLGHDTATEPQPRWLSFLLRASFLAGDKRARGLHMSVGGLRYVWNVVGRPSFTGDGKTDGAEYAVCVRQAGYRGPYEGGWLTWK